MKSSQITETYCSLRILIIPHWIVISSLKRKNNTFKRPSSFYENRMCLPVLSDSSLYSVFRTVWVQNRLMFYTSVKKCCSFSFSVCIRTRNRFGRRRSQHKARVFRFNFLDKMATCYSCTERNAMSFSYLLSFNGNNGKRYGLFVSVLEFGFVFQDLLFKCAEKKSEHQTNKQK